jgi:hypothetical protein
MYRHFGFAVALAVASLLGVPGRTALAAESTVTHPVGGSCSTQCPVQDFHVTTDGVLRAAVAVELTCVSTTVQFSVDGGAPIASNPVPSGGTTGAMDLGPVSPGTHTLTVGGNVTGAIQCDSLSWSGTLTVTTAGVSDDDVAIVPPGGDDTVSTVVTGSPRPAGIRARLFHAPTASASARISVATFDGLPAGLPGDPYQPGDPYRAAGFLDLQLARADDDDEIVGEFYAMDPIYPVDPAYPIDPAYPVDPALPPNPVRLAYWDGHAWSRVLGSGGSLPTYDSVANRFDVTFDLTSTPKVTELSGTVFAPITGLFFRGFGYPVHSSTLNVAKAGRAIPLKWQVFDRNAAPVFDLDPAITRISSVAFACNTSDEPTDPVEEYAAGGSGLRNLGNGVFQLNWNTLKSYAGSCRRLRLDLGERNPDGTAIYRTADFQFTR